MKNKQTAEEDWVEFTTETRLPDLLQRIHLLGPNFNVQSKANVPFVEIVTGFEKGIKYKENADEIRGEVTSAITNHINYTRQHRHDKLEWIEKHIATSKRFLKENPNLFVTKTDKENKTVLIEADKYNSKMMELLNDEDTYCKLPTDPSKRIIKEVKYNIGRMVRTEEHPSENISSLSPSQNLWASQNTQGGKTTEWFQP